MKHAPNGKDPAAGTARVSKALCPCCPTAREVRRWLWLERGWYEDELGCFARSQPSRGGQFRFLVYRTRAGWVLAEDDGPVLGRYPTKHAAMWAALRVIEAAEEASE